MKKRTKRIRYGVRPIPQTPVAQQAAPQPEAMQGRSKAPARARATPNVTPQQQAAYASFVNACYRIIFNPGAFGPILKLVFAHNNPPQGLASAVVMVVMQVEEQLQKQRQPPTDEPILLRGALEVLTTLSQSAELAKIHKFTPKELGEAIRAAIIQYTQQATQIGLFNRDMAQQQVAAYKSNPVFAPVLAHGQLPKLVAAAPKSTGKKQPAAHPSAPHPPARQTNGLLNQGAQ